MAEARQQISTKDQGQKSTRTECINSSITADAVPIAFHEFKEKTSRYFLKKYSTILLFTEYLLRRVASINVN
jgi:hypothetical protein